MLMEAVRWLEEAGLLVNQVEPVPADAHVDAVIEVAAADTHARFVVELKRRAPYPTRATRHTATMRPLAATVELGASSRIRTRQRAAHGARGRLVARDC